MSRFLPRTGWTWLETARSVGWRGSGAIPVDIPASYGQERLGVWFFIEVGIRRLLVAHERGLAVEYVLCVPASHRYQIITGSSGCRCRAGGGFQGNCRLDPFGNEPT